MKNTISLAEKTASRLLGTSINKGWIPTVLLEKVKNNNVGIKPELTDEVYKVLLEWLEIANSEKMKPSIEIINNYLSKTDHNELPLLIFQMDADMSDLEIKATLSNNMELAIKHKTGGLINFNGYNSDVREVWEIPEIQNYCQRLITLGFGACLSLENNPLGFSFIQIWLLSIGEMKFKVNVTESMKTEMLNMYQYSCRVGNEFYDRYEKCCK